MWSLSISLSLSPSLPFSLSLSLSLSSSLFRQCSSKSGLICLSFEYIWLRQLWIDDKTQAISRKYEGSDLVVNCVSCSTAIGTISKMKLILYLKAWVSYNLKVRPMQTSSSPNKHERCKKNHQRHFVLNGLFIKSSSVFFLREYFKKLLLFTFKF